MAEEIEFGGMLTKEEFLKLAQATRRRDGQIDEATVEKLVNWVIEKRTGAECARMLIDGFLTFEGFGADDNPVFLLPEDVLEETIRLGGKMETPMLEESYA